MRNIPIGVDDFKELRDKRAYYVDKTPLIADVLGTDVTKVFLYIRPRRFGKSLNLSMLDAYLDMKYEGNDWFDGLRISELRPDDPVKNSFPVVTLDFKDVDGDDFETVMDNIRIMITDLYDRFGYLADSDRISATYTDRFRRVLEGTSNVAELSSSIKHLCEMLMMHHGKKAVVLIDEYDSPLNSTYGTEKHSKVLSFIRSLLSKALKGNDSLEFAVITGVMQISKESIFSGLNNLKVNNIFSTQSDEMFGFTAEEVERLCADRGHPEKFEEARQWYDGYRFGDADIYNPWSVLNYIDSGFRPDEYWAGTSSNSIIPTLLDKADAQVYKSLRVLGSGSTLEKALDSRISYGDLTSVDGIYSVMTLSGYLKAVPSGRYYLLSIPNDEMYRVFAKMVTDRLDNPLADTLDSFCTALLDDEPERVADSLSSLITEVLSFRVLDHEHVYQAFTAGMLLSLRGRYEMTADDERGKGFYDILLRSRRADHPHIIVEFKRVRSNAGDDTLRKASQTALDQIPDREYFHGLEGEVLMYGVAVRGKDAVVVSDYRGIRWPFPSL